MMIHAICYSTAGWYPAIGIHTVHAVSVLVSTMSCIAISCESICIILLRHVIHCCDNGYPQCGGTMGTYEFKNSTIHESKFTHYQGDQACWDRRFS